MGGGFLREYTIGDEDYGLDGGGDDYYGGEYDYGGEYGDGEYADGGEYGGEGVDYGDYASEGGETKLPDKDDYYADYEREKKRRRRRRRRQANEVGDDYEYSVSEKGGALQTNKTWLFNGNTWEEKAPMSIPRDRPACSIINMPDGEVGVYTFTAILKLILVKYNFSEL